MLINLPASARFRSTIVDQLSSHVHRDETKTLEPELNSLTVSLVFRLFSRIRCPMLICSAINALECIGSVPTKAADALQQVGCSGICSTDTPEALLASRTMAKYQPAPSNNFWLQPRGTYLLLLLLAVELCDGSLSQAAFSHRSSFLVRGFAFPVFVLYCHCSTAQQLSLLITI